MRQTLLGERSVLRFLLGQLDGVLLAYSKVGLLLRVYIEQEGLLSRRSTGCGNSNRALDSWKVRLELTLLLGLEALDGAERVLLDVLRVVDSACIRAVDARIQRRS